MQKEIIRHALNALHLKLLQERQESKGTVLEDQFNTLIDNVIKHQNELETEDIIYIK